MRNHARTWEVDYNAVDMECVALSAEDKACFELLLQVASTGIIHVHKEFDVTVELPTPPR